MKTLQLIPTTPKLPFVAMRRAALTLSLFLIVASIGLFAVRGLNLGIDFRGGSLIEIKTDGPADLAGLRARLGDLGLGDVSIQEFGAPDEVLIRVQKQEGDDSVQQNAIRAVKGTLGDTVEYRRTEVVGPTVGEELMTDGILSVAVALGAIMIYIWFRFEWQFAVGAVIALIHDVITTVGVFALSGMEVNLSTVAAVLTIAGYSINDTVVVYDRVRENLRKYRRMEIGDLLNLSVNETLSRTVVTSVTTLLALLALALLGGEVLTGFSFALIWGVLIGTYSSICVAVPFLLWLDVRRDAPDPDRPEETSEPARTTEAP